MFDIETDDDPFVPAFEDKTPTYLDLSLDIETLSTEKNGVVTSISLVPFTDEKVLETEGVIVYLKISDQLKAGRHISEDTLAFWADQDPELFKQQLTGGVRKSVFGAASVLKKYLRNLNSNRLPLRVWCKGPAFDGAILEDLFKKENMILTEPWMLHYRCWRDVRTIVDAAQDLTGTKLVSHFPIVAHDPFYDAVAQAKDVIVARALINNKETYINPKNINGRDIVAGLTGLSKFLHTKNVEAGWWKDPNTGEDLRNNPYALMTKASLIFTELSEAIEGFRTDSMDDKLPDEKAWDAELADVAIRLLDLAGATVEDFGGVIEKKLAYNAKRADHKVENRKKTGGKKF